MLNPSLSAFILLWTFLIQSLCKYDAKSFLVCFPPLVGLSYTIVIVGLFFDTKSFLVCLPALARLCNAILVQI